MKKVLLTLGFIGAVMAGNAQIKQGTISVGGSLDFSSTGGNVKQGGTTVDKSTTTSFGIMPMAQYYLTDNLAIGLGIGYSTTSIGPDSVKQTESMFNIAPGVRYNMAMTDKFGGFLQGTVNLGFGSSNVKVGGATVDGPKITDIDISVKPGLLYFLKDNLAIEATYGSLGYNTHSKKSGTGASEKTDTDNTFGLNLNTSSLRFGFMLYFGGK